MLNLTILVTGLWRMWLYVLVFGIVVGSWKCDYMIDGWIVELIGWILCGHRTNGVDWRFWDAKNPWSVVCFYFGRQGRMRCDIHLRRYLGREAPMVYFYNGRQGRKRWDIPLRRYLGRKAPMVRFSDFECDRCDCVIWCSNWIVENSKC